jgi:succinoglycan biosynthesis protein ExoM
MENLGELLLVGICTFRRPNMLAHLLEACSKLEPLPGLRLGILIVDNDAAGSALPAVEAARSTMPMPIHYAVETRRGIANARNRVLEEALSLSASFLAFIDDDEYMQPDWLLALYRKMQETGADAVGSDVFWDLPPDAPAWAHALPTSQKYEELYGRKAKKRKPRIYPSTNNVLMKARIFGELGIRFDLSYGLAAGEDLDFFIRAKAAGATYAFTPDAAILEHVPPSRLTLRWRFSRWINFSSVNVKMHALQSGRSSAWHHYFFRAIPGFITGPAILAVAPFAGPQTLLRGLKHLGGSIGVMKGLFGQVADEYRTTHGS